MHAFVTKIKHCLAATQSWFHCKRVSDRHFIKMDNFSKRKKASAPKSVEREKDDGVTPSLKLFQEDFVIKSADTLSVYENEAGF